jgi:8-oxo-dGTP pyrophosphatase MutT (NUDIX family)
MTLHSLISSLQTHGERFPAEQKYAQSIITFLEQSGEKSFHNHHWEDGHITASMLVVNEDFTKLLLMFHKKYQIWCQFGGHSDDSPDVLATAIREFHEESGVVEEPEIFSYYPSHILPIFDLDIHDIPAFPHKWQPAHKHYDIRFLGIISDTVSFSRQLEETDDMRWFDIDSVGEILEEEGLIRMLEKVRVWR